MKRTPPNQHSSKPTESGKSSDQACKPKRPKTPVATKASTSKSKTPESKASPACNTPKTTTQSVKSTSASVGTGTASVTEQVPKVHTVVPRLPQGVAAAHTKQAQLITLLQSPSGACMAQMMALTGWQSHTVRGLISGTLRKRLGLTVQLEVNGDQRMYRIVKGRIAKSDIVEGVQP